MRAANVQKTFPTRTDADGNRLCAWCGKPCRTNRHKYCSSDCQDEVYVRCTPDYACQKVWKRDRGVCALCGCDTEKIERILRAVQRYAHDEGIYRWPDPDSPPHHRASAPHITWKLRQILGFTRDHLWEMDHIKPVIEGGGLCGLENLRTLCTECHDRETARLRARLAKRRRDAKPLPLFDAV